MLLIELVLKQSAEFCCISTIFLFIRNENEDKEKELKNLKETLSDKLEQEKTMQGNFCHLISLPL